MHKKEDFEKPAGAGQSPYIKFFWPELVLSFSPDYSTHHKNDITKFHGQI